MSFTRKKIDLTVTLGTGSWGETVGQTVKLSGFRCIVDLLNAGGDHMTTAQVRIFGLTPSQMDELTTIGTINLAKKLQNRILIDAGDDENGMRRVYSGHIFNAWADYNAAPDVVFNILAYAGGDASLRPASPTSYQGAADVGAIMAALANTCGYGFQNNGVNIQLVNPYFSGSALDQIRDCARAAAIRWEIGMDTLIISPASGIPEPKTVPVISPKTGLVGYPAVNSQGLAFTSLFNPDMKRPMFVDMQSSIKTANGKWIVASFTHSISCELPDGPWFTIAECRRGTN